MYSNGTDDPTQSLGHPGPALVYLAKAPTGQTAKTFNGDGQVWFKIAELGPTFNGLAPPNNKVSWATDSMSFSIPPCSSPWVSSLSFLICYVSPLISKKKYADG